MTDDLGGYTTDTLYPAQLQSKLTPGWLAASALRNGWRAPEPRGAFRMLDIGCGDGIGLAVTAASHPEAEFEGLDGMAEHIARGQAFARDLPNIRLHHMLFDQALEAGGAPCDFVTMHGVIAWVAPPIRAQALALASQRLAPGGLCAISYNAMPGWSDRLGYQHMIYRIAGSLPGDGRARYFAAHDQVRALAEAGFPGIPLSVVDFFESMQGKVSPDYFAHEFLNSGFQPLWSAHVRAEMSAHGLTYLGQAEYERIRPDFSLTARQQAELDKVTDPDEWDTAYDLAVNSPFRIDLYGKAPRRAEAHAFDRVWLSARGGADATLQVKTPAGTLKFDNPAARGVLEALQDGPATLIDLAGRLDLGLADIRNATDCLALSGLVQPCAPPGPTDLAEALNRRLSEAARSPAGAPISALAGAHGPISAKEPAIGVLYGSAEEIIASARHDAVIRDRYFHDEVDLEDPAIAQELDAACKRERRRLARRGIPIPKV